MLPLRKTARELGKVHEVLAAGFSAARRARDHDDVAIGRKIVIICVLCAVVAKQIANFCLRQPHEGQLAKTWTVAGVTRGVWPAVAGEAVSDSDEEPGTEERRTNIGRSANYATCGAGKNTKVWWGIASRRASRGAQRSQIPETGTSSARRTQRTYHQARSRHQVGPQPQ